MAESGEPLLASRAGDEAASPPVERADREQAAGRLCTAATAAVAAVSVLVVVCGVAGMLAGMHPWKVERQHAFHARFSGFLSNESCAQNLRELTKVPHLAGTESNMLAADYVVNQLEKYGLTTHTRDYDVLLSYPVSHELTVISSDGSENELKLKEGTVPEDPFSSAENVAETFHSYSPSGHARGEVVYANYGRTEDFETLIELDVDVQDAIVVTRYGKIFRGDKVANAAKFGAAAVLIYSDPENYSANGTEGYYPESRWLPASGVQRGSVFEFKGDPMTPGWPSTVGCERLSTIDPNIHLPLIPSLPISFGDARPILAQLRGELAPHGWRGALDLPHHRLGKGPVEVDLRLELNLTIAPIRNVFAVIEGAVEPDRYVLLGNDRDAWTFGAVDPNSGTAALLEVHNLYRKSLREAFGDWMEAAEDSSTVQLGCGRIRAGKLPLIGSTEWAEENLNLLRERAVAYLNVDCGVKGPGGLLAAATPQLDHIIKHAASLVKDPDHAGKTLLDTWQEMSPKKSTPKIGRMGGGGTDYAAFLQHVGVSSIDLSFGPASGDYPVYHSVYDNFHWMSNFGDPGFQRHVAVASLWGLLALRLADSDLLPFEYSDYAADLKIHVVKLDELLMTVEAPGNLTTKPLHRAVSDLANSAGRISTETMQLKTSGGRGLKRMLRSPVAAGLTAGEVALHNRLRALNDRFLSTERAFLGDGIPGRPWFKHLVYGPPKDDGYGSAPFPSLVDALSNVMAGGRGGWPAVQHEIYRASRAVARAARALDGNLF
eukprot:SM000036S13232  [mRNA]  locus=s36:38575:43897:- [translate_table: standard]